MAEKEEKVKKQRKKLSKPAKIAILSIVGALLLVFVLNIIILPLTGAYNRVQPATSYDGDNQYIALNSGTMLSAHRAGGDLAPEETLAAFKLCMEAEDYRVDIVEFDLHLTSDGELVLMHDHEVDRTSNGPQVFGKTKVKAHDKTLAELKRLNFGYNFQAPDGSYPYRDLPDSEVPDDVRILTLDEILTYLKSKRPNGDLNYIIEIKDGGEIGKRAMDKLYESMEKFEITDKVIVGTFKDGITRYIDKNYKGKVKRSASILEVLNFYYAFLWGVKQNPDKLKFDVLQIPMGLDGFFDFSTKAFIGYAHSLGIAVQYWTINDADDVRNLKDNLADAIMTDNPAMAYEVLAA